MSPGDFFESITLQFGDLTLLYKLMATNRFDYFVILQNENCVITITYDHGLPSCMVSDPRSDSGARYHVIEIYKLLNPNKGYQEEPEIYNVEERLRYFHDIIKNSFQPILNGDFTWVEIANKINDETKCQIEYVLKNFTSDHPIKKKFWNSDITWKNDLQLYLRKEGK